jgi:hypothetical protein
MLFDASFIYSPISGILFATSPRSCRMKPYRYHLPAVVTILLAGAALLYGPIGQLADYHHFADQAWLWGMPHAADVLSNLGFALVALWGWRQLAVARGDSRMACGWAGYRLFLAGLLLTAFGSAYYHLAPDNARLVWDRLPIALACAGLLAGVAGDCRQQSSRHATSWLALAAVASVAWWHFTEQAGAGDLRPYLLLQVLPIVLIPLWQGLYRVSRSERWTFVVGMLIYGAAKFAELYDHEIAAALGVVSGHTLKHLLATASAALIVASLVRRVRTPAPQINIARRQPGTALLPTASAAAMPMRLVGPQK